MKKFLLIAIAAIALSFNATAAGDGSWNINVQGGVMYRSATNALVSLEWERRYQHIWEAFVDMQARVETSNGRIHSDTFFDRSTILVGAAYKPAFLRWKNSVLRARVGAGVGIESDYTFTTGLSVGLEFSLTFRNRMQLVASQKNDFHFWARDNFRNGILVGVKFPIN
jgi:hypothetical protein